jgi:hypothetical protein
VKLSRVLALCVAAVSAVGASGLTAVPCGKDKLVVGIGASETNPVSANYYGQGGVVQGTNVSYVNELARRLQKNVEYKVVEQADLGVLLNDLISGSIDIAVGPFGLTGTRLEIYGALAYLAQVSAFWAVAFYQQDCQVPAGYTDPLTVTKTLLANEKKIGSRRSPATVQYQYLFFIATSPAPVGLGLSSADATALLNELIVDVSNDSTQVQLERLKNGAYFALLIADGLPNDTIADVYQPIDPCVSGYNDVPKENVVSLGRGYILNRSCCQLMQDLQVAFNDMILDGSFERLQREAIIEFNRYFGYTPDSIRYVDPLDLSDAPPINFSLTAQPVAPIPSSCDYAVGSLPKDDCLTQAIKERVCPAH